MAKFKTEPGPSSSASRMTESHEPSEMSSNDDSNSSDEAANHDEDEYAAVRKEMSEMSFEDLLKLKEKLGVKVFNSALYGSEGQKGKTVFKRENKNRPMEISSKRRPRRQKPVIEVKKRSVRDPRFDDLSGQYNEELFNKSYGFLSDIKERESQKLQKSLRKEKNPEKKQELKILVNRTKQQKLAEVQKQRKTEREKFVRKIERTSVKEGKTPYYLKKSDKAQLELAEKFKELKKSGKLENYLQKKRKKISSKDKKKFHKKF